MGFLESFRTNQILHGYYYIRISVRELHFEKKKDSRVKCALNFIQLYTKVVKLLNKNEHFKDRNIQKSTQIHI